MEVSARLNQDGVIYVYALPVEVTIAPDDQTIITYGISANVTAGVNSTLYIENLQSTSSYTLYISGRGLDNTISSPSRIVRVVTTSARIQLFDFI